MKKVYYVIEIGEEYFKSRNFLDRFDTVKDIEDATTAASIGGKIIRLKSNVDK